ncbi:MAG: zinc ribbon domain-containing protein [Candidatus Nealsonbacteria bacterium]|nr:zinc ribbon domain-containing protein [Candidatus Nealsonbacteria bacterium]
MIVFGWGGGHKVLGEGFFVHCPNCGNATQWTVVETSKRISLYFVPVAKWSKRYWMTCSVCSGGVELPSRQFAQQVLAAALQDPTEIPEHLERTLIERFR